MHSITPYLFKVVDNNNIPQDLWNINGGSFYDYLKKDYLPKILNKQIITKKHTPTELGQNFLLRKVYKGTSESVAGSIDVGVFGFESTIYDTQTKKIAHKKSMQESDLHPFNFVFYTPKSNNIAHRLFGFLLLSRFNNRGIRSIFSPHLVLDFEKTYPGLKLKIEKAVPAKVMSAIIKGSTVKTIRIFENKLSSDISTLLSPRDQKNFQEVEIIVRTKPKTCFSDVNWVWDAISQRKKVDNILTLPNITPTKIKVSVDRNGKTRSVNLGNVEALSSTIDLDAPTIIKSTGHVDIGYWLEQADDIADGMYDEVQAGLPRWKNTV